MVTRKGTSHQKWIKPGCPPILLATHSKELKKYQMEAALNVLKEMRLIKIEKG